MISSPAISTDTPAAANPDQRRQRRANPDQQQAIQQSSVVMLTDANFDASSHEGLRLALHGITEDGWESAAGRAVVEALQHRAGSWAFLVDRRCGRPAGATDPADVVAVAWLTLEKFATKTAEAQRPWAYLWTAVGNELTRSAVAEAQLTDAARVRSTSSGPVAVVRVGLETAQLDAGGDVQGVGTEGSDDAGAQLSPAGVELARRLATEGSDVDFWLDAIGRSLDVMADARRSYEEYMLRRDMYVREVLGLTLDEISALAALLIGPRKGDRAAQSLLLALHRDITVPTDTVAGAGARISLLRARRHAIAQRSAA
ncbi:MAG TPA: hypothetical protein VES02_16240 [Dermatophilaceae bacterium]|nr:hypothetical protein [Dermatophilaceae bacterium]